MYLNQLHEVFCWDEESPVLTRLRGQYDVLLDARFESVAAQVAAGGRDGTAMAAFARDRLAVLPDAARHRLLATPECSYRLLWGGDEGPDEALSFVTALAVDLASDEPAEGLLNPARFAHDPIVRDGSGGAIAVWPFAPDLPLDVASPYARTVDVDGTAIRLAEPAAPYTPEELDLALARTTAAALAVRDAVPAAWSMVTPFTTMLHVLPDRVAPDQFSSGSSGQFVGRSVIANAHLAKVRTEHVAEALVHEAIHGVLYMDEQHDPWVLDPELYAGPMRIASPWTGNPLPLRPYLQACFVWYGLLSFWSASLSTSVFERDAVRDRLHVAASGFLRGDLLARVAPVADRLAPELLEGVGALQQTVLTWFPVEEVAS
jgi:hypothetical protein